jgi:hypothetical protein
MLPGGKRQRLGGQEVLSSSSIKGVHRLGLGAGLLLLLLQGMRMGWVR